MSFARWLRTNSEHYLLIAAQDRIARQYGTQPPPGPHGAREWFWLRIFVPTYRRLPWSLRHKVMLTMPGSHRRTWAPPPKAYGSAVQSHLPSRSTQPEKEFGNGSDRG
jgi:hypothetical protein